MRTKVFCAALAGLVLSASGCGHNQGSSAGPTGGSRSNGTAKPVIGISLLTQQNPFFTDMAAAMKEEAAKQGYDVVVNYGDLDAARQKDQVNDFIVKKVSAIILSPCDSRAVATAIQSANQAGIPVFTADIRCEDKAAKVVSHVATDNFEGGALAGKAMVEALGGKGRVAIIDHPEVESGQKRTAGFKKALAAAPGIKIVAELAGSGERDRSFAVAQDILQKNPQIDGIFAINDPTALGVVAALEKAGRAGQVKVIGFDGQPEARKAVKAGKIYGDAVQFPDRIGQTAVKSVIAYLGGEKQPEQVLIPTELYLKADADKDPSLK